MFKVVTRVDRQSQIKILRLRVVMSTVETAVTALGNSGVGGSEASATLLLLSLEGRG
jgi:hypothetical protein